MAREGVSIDHKSECSAGHELAVEPVAHEQVTICKGSHGRRLKFRVKSSGQRAYKRSTSALAQW